MTKPLHLYWHADKKDWLPYKPGEEPITLNLAPVPEGFDREEFNRSAIEKIAMALAVPNRRNNVAYQLWLEIDAGATDEFGNAVLSRFGTWTIALHYSEVPIIRMAFGEEDTQSILKKDGAYNFYGKTGAECLPLINRCMEHMEANKDTYNEIYDTRAVDAAWKFLAQLRVVCTQYPKCVIKVL